MRVNIRSICFTGALLLGGVASSFATGKDSTAMKYASHINTEDLSEYLHILASDKFEGRETGEKGQKMAAEYLAAHFKELGIPPSIDGGYFQKIPLIKKYPEGVSISSQGKKYELLKDFYFLPGIKDVALESSEVVFAGYGIEDDNYSDYAGLDAKGKILLIVNGEPIDKKGVSYITGEKKFSEWTTNRGMKMQKAIEKGVGALLIVDPAFKQNTIFLGRYVKQPKMSLDIEADDKEVSVPTIYISPDLADDLLSSSKKSLDKLKKKLKKGKPNSFSVANDIKLNFVRKQEKLEAENVLAFIEGSDDKLKDEIVVLTAHYDHIGKDGEDINNGADDDGSGTVALMELAEAFAEAKKAGDGPRRSILIMPVSGEEKGLLGSDYYTRNPVYPLENTVADLNIDMIGRIDKDHDNGDYVYLIGSDRLSTELHDISERTNLVYTSLDLDYKYNDPEDPNQFYYRSDHYNFAKNNIPVIFYFNGTHDDYHKPTDTVEKIDFEKIEKITRLVFYTAWEIANRDRRLVVDVIEEGGDQ